MNLTHALSIICLHKRILALLPPKFLSTYSLQKASQFSNLWWIMWSMIIFRSCHRCLEPHSHRDPRSGTNAIFFLFVFTKIVEVCLEGNQCPPTGRIFFSLVTFNKVILLGPGPLKGLLSWYGALQGPLTSTYLLLSELQRYKYTIRYVPWSCQKPWLYVWNSTLFYKPGFVRFYFVSIFIVRGDIYNFWPPWPLFGHTFESF